MWKSFLWGSWDRTSCSQPQAKEGGEGGKKITWNVVQRFTTRMLIRRELQFQGSLTTPLEAMAHDQSTHSRNIRLSLKTLVFLGEKDEFIHCYYFLDHRSLPANTLLVTEKYDFCGPEEGKGRLAFAANPKSLLICT